MATHTINRQSKHTPCNYFRPEMTKADQKAAKRFDNALRSRIYAQLHLGESKHLAKQKAREEYLATHGSLEGYNPARVDGVYSYQTAHTYMRQLTLFSKFCVCVHGLRHLAQLTQEIGEQYIQMLSALGYSAWYVATTACALNKAMGWKISPKNLGLPPRRKSDIWRCRAEPKPVYVDIEQQTVARASGMRRMSVTKFRGCDCVRNADNQVIGIHVKEKGGKHRIAPILAAYVAEVTAIIDTAVAVRGTTKPVFISYTRRVCNHRLRAEYAANLLHQLENERAAGAAPFSGHWQICDYCHLKGKDCNRGPQTQGHDTELLGAVSGALGHNRVCVVLDHYMYLY